LRQVSQVEAPLVVADGASVTAGRTATAGRRGRGTGGRRGEGDGVFKDNAETQRSRRLAEIPPSFVGRRDLCEAHATAWHGRLLYVNVYLWDSIRMPVSFFSNTLLGIVDLGRWSCVVRGITNRRNLTRRARSTQRAGRWRRALLPDSARRKSASQKTPPCRRRKDGAPGNSTAGPHARGGRRSSDLFKRMAEIGCHPQQEQAEADERLDSGDGAGPAFGF